MRRSARNTISNLLLLLFAGILGFWSPPAGAETRHPQDGPHVDVRLFVEEEEVVVRLEMNLVFLDEMIDFSREDPNRISSIEWPALQPLLEAEFTNGNAVTIDGTRVEPVLESLQINNPDLRLLPLFPYSGERGLRKIRFELHYPVADPPPSSVSFEWDTYPPNILVDFDDPPPLAIAAELDAEGIRTPLVFSTVERGFTWHALGGDIDSRLLAVPTSPSTEPTTFPALAIGLFLVGGAIVAIAVITTRSRGNTGPVLVASVIEMPFIIGGAACLVLDVGAIRIGGGPVLPSTVEAESIFQPLHANVYRAFDYVEERDIYDALARSAEGEFLETLYRTIFRDLVMQEEGGAVARVTAVRPLSIEVTDVGVVADEDGVERPVFNARCRWQVDGVVSHWGHAHSRTNEYLADWSVHEGPEGWRLAGAEILEQDRVAESSTDGSTPDASAEFDI